MSPDRLLQYFETISEADDAAPRLRRFILDLAVRGKLVEQNPADEPASDLLKRIDHVKARLEKDGKIKIEKASPPDDNRPYAIPAGWAWVRLGSTGKIFNGNSVSESEKRALAKTKDGHPFIATKDVGYGRDMLVYDNGLRVPRNAPGYKIAHTNAVLICSEGGSAGKKIGLTDRNICFGNKLYANEVWEGINPRYIFYVYQTPSFSKEFSSRMTGIIGGIARSDFLMLPVPIPPENEQHRIVAKVDELMSLCDEMEVARTRRETRRDHLVSATLHRLNNGDASIEVGNGADFKETARFYFNHLPRLTTRPEHIKQLRQTILNLAVRGKLVAQDSNDEPAPALLAAIAVRKSKVGSIRTGRDWVGDNKKPVDEAFTAHSGWAWTRIANAVERVTVGYVGPMKGQYVNRGIPFLRSQNVRANRFRENGLIYISEQFHRTIAKSALAPGDVVVVRSGNVGTACAIPPSLPVANCSDLVVVKNPLAVVPEYLCFYLNSLAAAHVEAGTVGMALTHFNTKSVATMPLPLPPLAEQHRIVAKVDELMALCDKMEAQITTTATTRRQLLETTLHEALSSGQVALKFKESEYSNSTPRIELHS